MHVTCYIMFSLHKLYKTNLIKSKSDYLMNRSNKKTRRNWFDLPESLTISILSCLEDIEIVTKVRKVCKIWRQICDDPMMWRTINIRHTWNFTNSKAWRSNAKTIENVCGHAVRHGLSKVSEIRLENICSDRLLSFIASRTKRLKRLSLVLPNVTLKGVFMVASKFHLLEELELSYSRYKPEALDSIGRHCPRLKSLKINIRRIKSVQTVKLRDDGDALAIAKTMHGLKKLQIVGNRVTNVGLLAILDGCKSLESLDLRRCYNLDVEGDLELRCMQQIKQLCFPDDSIEDYELNRTEEIVYNCKMYFAPI